MPVSKRKTPIKRKPTIEKEVVAEVANDVEPETKTAIRSVKIRSLATPLRNPYTGTLFTSRRASDVINLNSDENFWTRKQLEAGVLEIV